MNRFAVQLHFQDVRLKPPAFAFGAAHVEIAQELHLDFLETGAATTFAAAAAGIEGERARGQSLRHRFRLRGEKFAHAIVEAEIKNRRRARRARERRLIDHHDVADAMRAGHALACARFLVARFAARAQQIPIKNVVNQRRFAGTGNAGHAGENAEWNFDIDFLEIVFARAGDLDRRGKFPARFRNRESISREIIARKRYGWRSRRCDSANCLRDCGIAHGALDPQNSSASVEDQFAAALAAAGTDIDQIIGRANDRFFVLDHEQRVAFVAQIVHHAHEPADIARMQTDARFVHDEKRVHERRAETGREIHALHFAAAQCARRAIEREITEADFAKITQARADFAAQHLRRRVVRRKIDVRENVARSGNRERRQTAASGRAFAPFCRILPDEFR